MMMFRIGGISASGIVLAVVALTLFLQDSCAALCNSGVLRMKPYPKVPYDACFPASYLTQNSIKSLCGVEYKALVEASGIIRLTPLSLATVTYGYMYGPANTPMACKALNASGLFNAGSSTAATVMLFDEVRGPHSNLTKTGSDQVTLSIGVTYGFRGPGPICAYNFTVVSGCFMGITAPPTPPPCPPAYSLAKGLAGATYCAPCPPGTSSTGPNAPSCTPCPPGQYNGNYGGTCKKCEQGWYAPKAGAQSCDYCGTYNNQWNDGLQCVSCPAGSYVSLTNNKQCQKCKAGVKCCTVNPSADCPPCPANQSPGTSYTSVFALTSGSSPACLASTYALCAPKFNITIDDTCRLFVQPMPRARPEEQYCDWSGYVGIRGKAASAKADLAALSDWSWSDLSLLAGNVTLVSPPYMDFTLPSPKCTLRYRALTTPAAKLLGVPPKSCPEGTPGCSYRPPSSAAICPAGQYLEEDTDTKPAPCLPCPPGTFSKAPSNKPCTPCPAGLYASGIGNTACRRCPISTPLTTTPGTARCQECGYNEFPKGLNKCQACPNYSNKFQATADACLSNQLGSTCCAAGNCAGQEACSAPLQPEPTDYYSSTGAVLKLGSKNLPQPLCQKATLLTCLDASALLLFTASGSSFRLDPVMQPRCFTMTDSYSSSIYLYGSITSTKRAAGTYYNYNPYSNVNNNEGYEILSDAAKNTITIYVSKTADPGYTAIANITTQCSATFQLSAGYALDLKPPTGASCPANAITVIFGGRTFCKFCPSGQFKKASNATCVPCPKGTYQDLVGSTSCKPCPKGSTCYEGSTQFYRCQGGTYLASPGSDSCTDCKANTYTPKTLTTGFTACLPCPKGLVAPAGSSICGVPFLK